MPKNDSANGKRFPNGRRVKLNESFSQDCPGVYAFFLKKGSSVPGLNLPHERPIYIGKCESNFDRRGHIICRDSSGSTFRRTLGALLRDAKKLESRVFPRGFRKKPNAKSFQNFRFSPQAEGKLTAWIQKNLEITFEPIAYKIGSVEAGCIEEWNPPLNLVHSKNDLRDRLLELRKECRSEARETGEGKWQ